MSDMEKKIREILKNTVELQDEYDFMELGDEEELINYGVNSIVFISMIVELEEKFSIEAKDEDLDFTLFPTIKSVVTYVREMTGLD